MIARGYLLALVWLGGCCLGTYGGDWPTYRCDARRSSCSPDAVAPALALSWQQHLPAYQVAFPNEERQQFDPSHEPVCADGILVVGCPADGSVRAFAADSGREIWRFPTEGPVRLAPVLHQGRVLFGSDDGRFHCLDLTTGKPLWSCRAFPEERPDVRLLGNDRLISLWPVRGGPVVVGDTVYFASGVWPTMGGSMSRPAISPPANRAGPTPTSATWTGSASTTTSATTRESLPRAICWPPKTA